MRSPPRKMGRFPPRRPYGRWAYFPIAAPWQSHAMIVRDPSVAVGGLWGFPTRYVRQLTHGEAGPVEFRVVRCPLGAIGEIGDSAVDGLRAPPADGACYASRRRLRGCPAHSPGGSVRPSHVGNTRFFSTGAMRVRAHRYPLSYRNGAGRRTS